MKKKKLTMTPGKILGMRGYSRLQVFNFGSLEGSDKIAELLVQSVPAYTMKLTIEDNKDLPLAIGVQIQDKKYTLIDKLTFREGRKVYRVYTGKAEEDLYRRLLKLSKTSIPVTILY